MPITDRRRKILSQGDQMSAEIGELIREIRLEAGITQEDLSDMTGLPQEHISRIERGIYLAVTIGVIARIALALNRKLTII